MKKIIFSILTIYSINIVAQNDRIVISTPNIPHNIHPHLTPAHLDNEKTPFEGILIEMSGKDTNSLKTYRAGILEGLSIHYSFGYRQTVSPMKAGELEGTQYTYTELHYDHEENKIIAMPYIYCTIEYKAGKLHGKSLYYFPNGKVKKEENYLAGDKKGKFIFYDEAGVVVEQGEY